MGFYLFSDHASCIMYPASLPRASHITHLTSHDAHMNELMSLEDNGMCFACGEKNEKGLHLEFSFYEQDKRVESTFLPLDEHQGWQGVVHGGIIATLMDEAMAKLAQLLGFRALTASLDVRFKDVARTGEPLHVTAEVARLTNKLIYARAVINRGDGDVVAEAQSKLMIV